MKSGCLHGGNLSRTPAAAFRGVQVFTYRELENATGGFSERNVIGSNGGLGLMFRGVLSDGTLAAIKSLRSEGKQGERAFRIEVSQCASFNDFIYPLLFSTQTFNYFLLLLALSPFLVLDPVCSETLFLSFVKPNLQNL